MFAACRNLHRRQRALAAANSSRSPRASIACRARTRPAAWPQVPAPPPARSPRVAPSAPPLPPTRVRRLGGVHAAPAQHKIARERGAAGPRDDRNAEKGRNVDIDLGQRKRCAVAAITRSVSSASMKPRDPKTVTAATSGCRTQVSPRDNIRPHRGGRRQCLGREAVRVLDVDAGRKAPPVPVRTTAAYADRAPPAPVPGDAAATSH